MAIRKPGELEIQDMQPQRMCSLFLVAGQVSLHSSTIISRIPVVLYPLMVITTHRFVETNWTKTFLVV